MDLLKIYIDRLKDGETETLDTEVEASHFEIQEQELNLAGPISIRGSAYLTAEHLVVELKKVQTKVEIPCVVCNEPFTYSIAIDGLTLTTPLAEISGAIFDLTEEIRSGILLKVPPFAECHEGSCPQRPALDTYLGSKKNLPFSELNL